MGTTQTTDQTNKYDPGSMQTFEQLIGALGPTASGYINNPFGNPFFQMQQQMGNRQAQNLGGTQMSGLLRNLTAGGVAGGAASPAGLEMQQNQARANTGMQANLGFLQPTQNALGMQQGAMNLAAGFRPLQTGGTQTQSTSGLGTWLPQVASAGIGAAGAAMGMPSTGGGGGLASLFSGGGGNLFGGPGAGGYGSGFGGAGGTNWMGSGPGGGYNPGGFGTGWSGGIGSTMPPPAPPQ